jgi:hypothetical protein
MPKPWPVIRASFRADTSQLEAAIAELSRGIRGPMTLLHESVDCFACVYCAGVSDGLSCVHCGAPRRVMAKLRRVEVTAHNDPIRTYLET